MMDKAIQLLQQAAKMEERQRKGEKVNTFKKAWGLQKDGNMWETAWKAVLHRGASNQKIRKVKGHATEQDVEQGRSTAEDRFGNDKADKNTDEGAELVHGGGFVKLGQWLADRHTRYVTFYEKGTENDCCHHLGRKRSLQKSA